MQNHSFRAFILHHSLPSSPSYPYTLHPTSSLKFNHAIFAYFYRSPFSFTLPLSYLHPVPPLPPHFFSKSSALNCHTAACCVIKTLIICSFYRTVLVMWWRMVRRNVHVTCTRHNESTSTRRLGVTHQFSGYNCRHHSYDDRLVLYSVEVSLRQTFRRNPLPLSTKLINWSKRMVNTSRSNKAHCTFKTLSKHSQSAQPHLADVVKILCSYGLSVLFVFQQSDCRRHKELGNRQEQTETWGHISGTWQECDSQWGHSDISNPGHYKSFIACCVF
jgi:hypothetical protein